MSLVPVLKLHQRLGTPKIKFSSYIESCTVGWYILLGVHMFWAKVRGNVFSRNVYMFGFIFWMCFGFKDYDILKYFKRNENYFGAKFIEKCIVCWVYFERMKMILGE